MSRYIRRVPLGFDWPLGERWHGFLRPDRFDEAPCEPCESRGYSPAARYLYDLWYGHWPFDPADQRRMGGDGQ